MGLGWQLARRNIRRRPTEAALVVLGSMLGTAIIVASFVVGDSFDGSIRDAARTALGPIDEVVRIRPPAEELDRSMAVLADRLFHTELAGTDGMIVARSAGAVLADDGEGDARRTDPSTCVLEVEPADARRFGPDPEITGLAGLRHGPAPGHAVLNRDEADALGLQVGDRLVVHAYGTEVPLEVERIVDEVGLAGYCGAIVPAGTSVALARSGTDAGSQPPAGLVLVSNDGGVFDSTAGSQRIADQLRSVASDALPGTEIEVETAKADTIREAELTGGSLQTLFTAVGGFSVIAGILLLVNLFVMLAEERKVELGVLRAIGLKRIGVWRAFSLEGAVYAVASALVGTALGVGIGALVVAGTNRIFAERTDRFTISLVARPGSLVTAAVIGAAIAMLTAWATSVRIARLNVISAVRDLPDPRSTGRRLGRLVLGLVGVVVGIGATVAGLRSSAEIPILLGVPLACFSAIGPLSRRLSSRIVTFTMSGLAITWGLSVFGLFGDEMAQPGIAVFVVMGVLLVGAAVAIATTLDVFWSRITLALSERGRGLSLRLAFAYPLARRFRTGMILAMFSLIIFSMTFMAAFSAILSSSQADAVRDIRAGFDLMIDSNASNPITSDQLEARPEVSDADTLLRSGPEMTIRYQPEPTRWSLTGFDADFVAHGAPYLLHRDEAYGSDRAAFEAVLADPDLAIVGQELLQDGAAPASDRPRVGDTLTVIGLDGTKHPIRVAGVMRSDFIYHGVLMGKEAVRSLMAPAFVENRQFVRLRPGHDPTVEARRLNAQLIDQGADALTFPQRVDDRLSRTTGFIRLMQMYLGFGMLIGVAGLGVVMVRAVRERRREIGMLRAMGVPASTVRRAFLQEAAFIAVQAVLTGIGLGLMTADQVVVNSGAFATTSVDFVIPWATIAVIATVPLVASLLATLVPAHRAARIRPAIALRTAD